MSFIIPSPITPSPMPVFGQPLYDLKASIEFMRDVTYMVASQVAFYRNLCPKSEFKEIEIFGREVQLLKKRSKNMTVEYIVKNLESAFDMMNQQHLKSCSLLIKDESRTYRLESYTLRYTYDCKSPSVSYSTSSKSDGANFPLDYIHNSTLDLLLRLQAALGDLAKPLPDVCMIDFELFFTDNAPGDYLPKGYRFETDEEAERRNLFIQTPLKLRSGQIKNDYTSLTVHTRFAKILLPNDLVDTDCEDEIM